MEIYYFVKNITSALQIPSWRNSIEKPARISFCDTYLDIHDPFLNIRWILFWKQICFHRSKFCIAVWLISYGNGLNNIKTKGSISWSSSSKVIVVVVVIVGVMVLVVVVAIVVGNNKSS